MGALHKVSLLGWFLAREPPSLDRLVSWVSSIHEEIPKAKEYHRENGIVLLFLQYCADFLFSVIFGPIEGWWEVGNLLKASWIGRRTGTHYRTRLIQSSLILCSLESLNWICSTTHSCAASEKQSCKWNCSYWRHDEWVVIWLVVGLWHLRSLRWSDSSD